MHLLALRFQRQKVLSILGVMSIARRWDSQAAHALQSILYRHDSGHTIQPEKQLHACIMYDRHEGRLFWGKSRELELQHR